jgi:hypothetical protein
MAYFFGVTSAGRYREISKPAATWHMVGFVQLFFIKSSTSHQPEWVNVLVSNHCEHRGVQWLVHSL